MFYMLFSVVRNLYSWILYWNSLKLNNKWTHPYCDILITKIPSMLWKFISFNCSNLFNIRHIIKFLLIKFNMSEVPAKKRRGNKTDVKKQMMLDFAGPQKNRTVSERNPKCWERLWNACVFLRLNVCSGDAWFLLKCTNLYKYIFSVLVWILHFSSTV